MILKGQEMTNIIELSNWYWVLIGYCAITYTIIGTCPVFGIKGRKFNSRFFVLFPIYLIMFPIYVIIGIIKSKRNEL